MSIAALASAASAHHRGNLLQLACLGEAHAANGLRIIAVSGFCAWMPCNCLKSVKFSSRSSLRARQRRHSVTQPLWIRPNLWQSNVSKFVDHINVCKGWMVFGYLAILSINRTMQECSRDLRVS